jgi:hypothetical protein
MTRDYMAIERAREAGQQPDYEDTKDCGCRECFLENEVERLRVERDRAIDDCEILVREVHALGAGAVMKSLFNDRQPVAPAGSTPSPAPISDYRKSYAVMFRREEREKLEALAKAERLTAEVEQLTAELCRMKSRPCETEFSHLDVMWQQLVRERDKAVFEVQRLRALPVHENK